MTTRLTTVILKRDGRHHLTLDNCTAEDAGRWSDEGYTVFQVAARGRDWAVLHVGSGKMFSSADAERPTEKSVVEAEFLLTGPRPKGE